MLLVHMVAITCEWDRSLLWEPAAPPDSEMWASSNSKGANSLVVGQENPTPAIAQAPLTAAPMIHTCKIEACTAANKIAETEPKTEKEIGGTSLNSNSSPGGLAEIKCSEPALQSLNKQNTLSPLLAVPNTSHAVDAAHK
jgi:hypothetical protein